MPDGKITFSTDLDNKTLEKKLSSLSGKIEESEKKLNDKKIKQSALKAELTDSKNEAKKTEQAIDRIKAQISDIKSTADMAGIKNPIGLSDAQAALKEQESIYKRQNNETERLDIQYKKITDSVMDSTESLNKMKAQAADISDQIEQASKSQSKFNIAIGGANKRFGKLLSRVSKLAARVFLFSVITSGLRAVRDWMGDVISSNDEASAALSRLKGALLTMVQPLVDVVIPAFITFINILTRVVGFVSSFVSKLFGTTKKKSAENAKALNDQSKAIKGVGASAKKASKDLASFDEINKLSGEQETGGGGGGSSDSGIAPDFSGEISQNLDVIESIVGASLLAIGAILAFSGANIPLGIALIAAGALTLAPVIKENWNAIKTALKGPIGIVTALVSGALLALGAILAFSGANIKLGIGLMVAGAVGLAAVAKINWGTIKSELQGPIGAIAAIVSVALLVLGSVLAFSGANIPLGIALIAAGAVGLATVASVNWDTIVSALQGPIGAITAIVSVALLVLGAILAFSGANIPLGIALIAAGAVGLATVASVNWDTIVSALQGPIGGVVAIVSSALLVLGIILLFSGAGIPLGLGLIGVGAAGLAASIVPNWNYLSQKLKDTWNSIKNWWDANVAKYFTSSWWRQLGIDAINGLMQSIESGLNRILRGAGSFVNKIGGTLNKIPGVNISPVSWGNISLPRLAQGAVIPPNREFMAVLGDQKHGTNIEAPLETIQEAVAIVMDDFISSNMAGQEAVVAVLRDILQAVLGIQIGDDVIGEAVTRYQQKMAVVKGY